MNPEIFRCASHCMQLRPTTYCVTPVREGATFSQVHKPHAAQILFLQLPSVLPFTHIFTHGNCR